MLGAFGGGTGATNQGTYTAITVNGPVYSAPPSPGTVAPLVVTADAADDALTAFNSLSPDLLPGGTDPFADLPGGKTIYPGTYKAASGLFPINESGVFLDAQGNSDAVWVFQSAGALTVSGPAAPRSIILTNGTQAKNVFWQVGSAATINGAGGGTMVGTINRICRSNLLQSRKHSGYHPERQSASAERFGHHGEYGH